MHLVDWINKKNISQKEMAKLIGVKQPSVSRWVNGKLRPSLDKVKKISLITNDEVNLKDF